MSEKAESGTVLAVCVSREKGTQKQNVGSAHFIEDFGIEGDAIFVLSSLSYCSDFLF